MISRMLQIWAPAVQFYDPQKREQNHGYLCIAVFIYRSKIYLPGSLFSALCLYGGVILVTLSHAFLGPFFGVTAYFDRVL